MSEPWDPPPFPKRGNRSYRVLLESIGRALTTWEELESYLANLYAALCGQDCYDQKANNLYGDELNFSGRIAALEQAGSRYFIKRPNQAREGELAWVIKYVTGYSRRRNDVAHGVVRCLQVVTDSSKTILGSNLEWCLIPPHFREKKYVTPNDPVHILTSVEINKFAKDFWPILRGVYRLALAVELPPHASRRRFVLPPPLTGLVLTRSIPEE